MSQSAITVTGNLTADPQLTFTASGTAKLALGIAVNYFWNDADGTRQERTSFFNCVAWKQVAEDAAAILEKGMRVVVNGRLEQRTYQDKEGKDRSVVEIVVEDIGPSVRGLASIQRKERAASNGNGQRQTQPAKATAKSRATVPTVQEQDEPF
jgi:single-strand DNA-binding protein